MRNKLWRAELRWDPVLGEWVLVSSSRTRRPWRPSNRCPFCPGSEEAGYGWDVLVLRNKYPMLIPNPPSPKKHSFYRVEKALGDCLIIVETPLHDLDDISDLSVSNIAKVIKVVKELDRKYSGEKWAKYLLWFRNKGEEVGVSLTHPHSQVYVLPFIPSKVQREIENSKKFYRKKKKCLFCRIIETEKSDGERVVFMNNSWIAFIPFYAHWPFEVHIYPLRHMQRINELEKDELFDLAYALKRVLCGIKKVYSKPMPYMLVLHQAPYHGVYGFYHLHIEIYGVYRGDGLLKYAAGMEMGGGNFTYDGLPEERAGILREVIEDRCME